VRQTGIPACFAARSNRLKTCWAHRLQAYVPYDDLGGTAVLAVARSKETRFDEKRIPI
jgi:hypothetical protein